MAAPWPKQPKPAKPAAPRVEVVEAGTPVVGFQPRFGPKAEPVERVRERVKRRKGQSVAPVRLGILERRGQVIRMRAAGYDFDEIAAEVGFSADTCRHDVDAWIAEQKPSEEQTEAVRQMMMVRLEALHKTWWGAAHGNYEDRWGRQIPNDKAAEILLKIQDRQAKLMGVDMQPQQVNFLPTAEAIAAFLGWDPQQGLGVVDVQPALPPAPNEEKA